MRRSSTALHDVGRNRDRRSPNLRSQHDKIESFYFMIAKRELDDLRCGFFLREELRTNAPVKMFDSISTSLTL